MTDSDDLGGILFRHEASELVQSIEAGLIALEQAPQDRACIDAEFRDLHTVKGSCAMFGFSDLAAFIHAFETAFDRLRGDEVAVSAPLIEISLQSTDQILRLLDAPEAATAQSAAILSHLELCLNGNAGRPPAEAPAPDAGKLLMPDTDPNVLFRSTAQADGDNARGNILTGMGDDGAACMTELRATGPRTLAQNEATCVVFGMPREAVGAGGVDRVLPLGQFAREIEAHGIPAAPARRVAR